MAGFGSFATVHRCSSDENGDNQVVKVSRYGAVEAPKCEADVLQKLQSDSSACAGVVQFVKFGSLNLNISDLPIKIPPLSLKPYGSSARAYLSLKNHDTECLKRIGNQISDALVFVHQKGFIHNDGTPENILLSGDEAFLNDFGLATTREDKIVGFRGTPRFVHRSVFGRYPKREWRAEADYDFAGLAFSVATISEKGKIPWKSFRPCKDLSSSEEFRTWANTRSKKSSKCLSNCGFDESICRPRWYDDKGAQD